MTGDALHVTYAEDPVFPGDWFADLRDSDGNVIETGSGTTKEAAYAHLCRRYRHHYGEDPSIASDEATLPPAGAGAPAAAGDDACQDTWTNDRTTYYCTLTPGHNGRHAAMAGDMTCASWGDVDGLEYFRPATDDLEDAAAQDDGEPDPHAARLSMRLVGGS